MEGGEREKGQVPRKKEEQEKDGHDCGQGGGQFGVQKSCCLKEFVFKEVFVKRSLVLYFYGIWYSKKFRLFQGKVWCFVSPEEENERTQGVTRKIEDLSLRERRYA